MSKKDYEFLTKSMLEVLNLDNTKSRIEEGLTKKESKLETLNKDRNSQKNKFKRLKTKLNKLPDIDIAESKELVESHSSKAKKYRKRITEINAEKKNRPQLKEITLPGDGYLAGIIVVGGFFWLLFSFAAIEVLFTGDGILSSHLPDLGECTDEEMNDPDYGYDSWEECEESEDRIGFSFLVCFTVPPILLMLLISITNFSVWRHNKKVRLELENLETEQQLNRKIGYARKQEIQAIAKRDMEQQNIDNRKQIKSEIQNVTTLIHDLDEKVKLSEKEVDLAKEQLDNTNAEINRILNSVSHLVPYNEDLSKR